MHLNELVGQRYRLVERLGLGGMAVVWRAYDSEQGFDVALKAIRTDGDVVHGNDTEERIRNKDELRERFRREARLLGGLHHPGIPELYGQGTHRGEPYMAMRLVEGPQLHKFNQRRRPFPITVAAAIAMQISEALACAHQTPVAHRDLKPQNIIVEESGKIALIDFGIARPLQHGATTLTARGVTLGSRGYMSPEQILEQPVDVRTDMYSFGCLLYELLAGRPPFIFEGDGAGSIQQHLNEAPEWIRAHAPRVPRVLDELVVEGLLAKQGADRPDDAAVAEALTPHLPHLGAPPPHPRLVPDPTRVFRFPESKEATAPSAHAEPRPGHRAPRPRKAASWLSRREVEEVIDRATRDLEGGEPGEAMRELAGLLTQARTEWGPRDTLFQRMRLVTADSLRDAGDCGQARPLYQEIADDNENDDPESLSVHLTARVGIAECRCPFGENDVTLEELRQISAALAPLPWDRKMPVIERCQELAVKLSELGYVTEVDDIRRSFLDL